MTTTSSPTPPTPSPFRATSVTIKNFKAIKDTTVPLSDFTVIVGTNGSGKSSVLQALHWMLQSARHPTVETNKREKASTLSALDATYMPSPEYKKASHSNEYGNVAASPRMDLKLQINTYGNETSQSSIEMWIKSARNEGISVHVPSSNQISATIRNKDREISAYIPGLSGIPLSEEKKSKRIVHRQAAAGDANTVLRNILLLLQDGGGIDNKFKELEEHVSKVLGKISIKVSFNNNDDYNIKASFQTEEMKKTDSKQFKPLELAGIGFLQVIQIFAYLIYFKPRFLLIDEPDCHLHPNVQERLTIALIQASKKYDCQVLLTTHSPSVVRALSNDASLVWMHEGNCSEEGTEDIRCKMGWGLMDKSILLVTEDEKTGMLNTILAQWPELQRKTAVWPAKGSSTLPPPESMDGLRHLFDSKMHIVLHRDSDFMLDEDKKIFEEPYKNRGIKIWFTNSSDIESYWVSTDILSKQLNISIEDAESIISDACNDLMEKARTSFNTKRNDVVQKIRDYKNGDKSAMGNDEAFKILNKKGNTFTYVGKDLSAKIKKVAQDKKYSGYHGITKTIPSETIIANDLKTLLEALYS